MSNSVLSSRTKISVKSIVLLILMLISLSILLIPTSETFTPQIKMFFVITLLAILNWAFEVIPLVVTSLLLPPFYIIAGVVAPAQAFLPWATIIPWLFAAGMIICSVFERSGLMKRIAYWCIIKAGGTYKGILFGLMITGIFMAIIMPSGAGRVTLFIALTYAIVKALNLEPKGKAASSIMLCGMFAAIEPGFIFLSGNEGALLSLNIAYKYDVATVSWMDFLIHNGPIFLIWCFITVFILLFLFKQDTKIEAKDFFIEEYKKLGKMSINEIKMAIIISLILVGVLTSSMHGISIAWIFLIGACACCFPGINIATTEDYKKINYSMMIFVASTMAIGVAAGVTGGSKLIVDAIYPLMQGGGNIFTVAGAWLFAVLINFVITPIAAMSSLTGPMVELATKVGVEPIPVIYGFLNGINQVIFPYEYVLVAFVFSYGMIHIKSFMKAFGLKMLLNIIFILLIAIPYWVLIGIL